MNHPRSTTRIPMPTLIARLHRLPLQPLRSHSQ
jgi:hypothetical protein